MLERVHFSRAVQSDHTGHLDIFVDDEDPADADNEDGADDSKTVARFPRYVVRSQEEINERTFLMDSYYGKSAFQLEPEDTCPLPRLPILEIWQYQDLVDEGTTGTWSDKVRTTITAPDNDAEVLRRFFGLDPLSEDEIIIRNLHKQDYVRKSVMAFRLRDVYPLGPVIGTLPMWTKNGGPVPGPRMFPPLKRWSLDVRSNSIVDDSWKT